MAVSESPGAAAPAPRRKAAVVRPAGEDAVKQQQQQQQQQQQPRAKPNNSSSRGRRGGRRRQQQQQQQPKKAPAGPAARREPAGKIDEQQRQQQQQVKTLEGQQQENLQPASQMPPQRKQQQQQQQQQQQRVAGKLHKAQRRQRRPVPTQPTRISHEDEDDERVERDMSVQNERMQRARGEFEDRDPAQDNDDETDDGGVAANPTDDTVGEDVEVEELDDEESSSMTSDDVASFVSSVNPATVATHATASSIASVECRGRKLDVATLFEEQRRFEATSDKVKVSVALDNGPPLEVFVPVGDDGVLQYQSDGSLRVTCASGVLRVAVDSTSLGIRREVEGVFKLEENVRLDAWTELNFVHDARATQWQFQGFRICTDASPSETHPRPSPAPTPQPVSPVGLTMPEPTTVSDAAPLQPGTPARRARGPPGFAPLPMAPPMPMPYPHPGQQHIAGPPPPPQALPQSVSTPPLDATPGPLDGPIGPIMAPGPGGAYPPAAPVDMVQGQMGPVDGHPADPRAHHHLQQQPQPQQQPQQPMMWFPYAHPGSLAATSPNGPPYFMYMPSAYAQMPFMYATPSHQQDQQQQPQHQPPPPQQPQHQPPPPQMHAHPMLPSPEYMPMPMMPMMGRPEAGMASPPSAPMSTSGMPEAFPAPSISTLDAVLRHTELGLQEMLLRSDWGRGRVMDMLRRGTHPDLSDAIMDRIGAGLGVLLLDRFASQLVLEMFRGGPTEVRERLVDLLDVSMPALVASNVACSVLLAAIKDMQDEAIGDRLLGVMLDNIDATELLAHPRALTLALATHPSADERVRAALSAAANPVRLATSRIEVARTMADAKFVDPAYVHVLAHHELGYKTLTKNAQLREACVERLDLVTLAKHVPAGVKVVEALLDDDAIALRVARILAEEAPRLVFDQKAKRLAFKALALLDKQTADSVVPNRELLELFGADE